MSSRTFGGLIWTNHSLERLKERRMSQEDAWQAFRYPDVKRKGRQSDTTEYQKKMGSKTITLIVKKDDSGQGIVISTWIDPPLHGTNDYKKRAYWQEYRRAGFWGKWWVVFKKALGI